MHSNEFSWFDRVINNILCYFKDCDTFMKQLYGMLLFRDFDDRVTWTPSLCIYNAIENVIFGLDVMLLGGT